MNSLFPENHEQVNSTNVLTGLDYMQDLEYTRKGVLYQTMVELGLDQRNWRTIIRSQPEILDWLEKRQDEESRIQALKDRFFIRIRVKVCVDIARCLTPHRSRSCLTRSGHRHSTNLMHWHCSTPSCPRTVFVLETPRMEPHCTSTVLISMRRLLLDKMRQRMPFRSSRHLVEILNNNGDERAERCSNILILPLA